MGDRSGIAEIISDMGRNELAQGHLDKAEPLLRQALEQMQELGMKDSIAETNFDLALLQRQHGNLPEAETHYALSHPLYTELGAMKDLERIKREWGK